MNIEATLKELLAIRRDSLIQNYRTMLNRDKINAQNWVEAATNYIKENILEKTYPEWMNGDARYSGRISEFGQFTAGENDLDTKLFEDVTCSYCLSFMQSRHNVQMENYPYGSYGNDIVTDIFRNVITRDRVQKSEYDVKYVRRWKTDSELDTLAEQMADNALADFVTKMTKKMDAIGKVESAKIDYEFGDLFQTRLFLKFENGISFDMVNSIVFKTSSRGRPFHQFPARFSNVRVNGQEVKHCASEAAVKRVAKDLQSA